jgi:hypothetical protein
MPIRIHDDLQSLIPPLSPEERVQLEANLLDDGCRDALIVWQEEQILLDGHHRYAICERHGLTYTIQELSLPDFDAARLWMIQNQLGRRNLSPNQMSYYRGEQYNLEKHRHGGDRKSEISSTQNGNLIRGDGASEASRPHTAYVKTVERLAAEHGVSRNTIARDGAYAEAMDTIATVLGPDVRSAIRDGDLPLTRQDVPLLASLVETSPEMATQIKAALQGTAPADELRAILTASRCGICHRPLSNPASVSRGIGPICAGHENGAHDAPAPVLVLAPEDPAVDEADAPATWPQNVSSGDPEWHTPQEILAPVRQVLGEIDLDPASCAMAQTRVQARTYYTLADDGLTHPWHGTIFLNPPYKHAEVTRFIAKLFQELDAGHTTEAILVVNNVTQTDWFQAVATRAEAVCFPDGKIPFLHATKDGLHPCSGQAICYFGPHVARFGQIFVNLGVIMQAMRAVAPAQLSLAEAPPAPAPATDAATSAPAPTPTRLRDQVGLQQAVWLTVQQLGPCTNAQVKEALGERRTVTHQTLQTLVKQGKVVKEGQTYRVVDAPA